MNPHIQLFFDMMQECYRVNGWKYDRELNVQFTNSKSPNLQKLLLLGFDRDKAILEHAATSDVPMIISDNLGLMWGIVEEKTGKTGKHWGFLCSGPRCQQGVHNADDGIHGCSL